jgi:hypothetical protein
MKDIMPEPPPPQGVRKKTRQDSNERIVHFNMVDRRNSTKRTARRSEDGELTALQRRMQSGDF